MSFRRPIFGIQTEILIVIITSTHHAFYLQVADNAGIHDYSAVADNV